MSRSTTLALAAALVAAAGAAAQEASPRDPGRDDEAVAAMTRRALDALEPAIVEVEALGGLEEGFEAPESEAEAEQQGGVLVRGGFKQAYGPSTGLILTADGVIATSAFVLNREPRHLFVTLASGETHVARVLGRDEARAVVLLKIDAEGLPVPELVTRAETRVGRYALAMGRGLGLERPTVARGIVSAVDRVGGRAIQSSALISPVNYGGPLASIEGEVFGLIVPLAMRGGMASVDVYDSGIGFAVPAEDLLELLPRLAAGEVLEPGFLGVVPDPASRDGVRLTGVAPGSPAAGAGIEAGDVILAVDGAETTAAWQLKRALSRKHAGDEVVLELRRGTREWEARLTLASPPQQEE